MLPNGSCKYFSYEEFSDECAALQLELRNILSLRSQLFD